jgi:hypothetical protein
MRLAFGVAAGSLAVLVGCGGETFSSPDAATSAGGASASAAATGTGGAGGTPDTGCADGQREGFLDLASEPDVAECSGAFSVQGVTTAPSMQPGCDRHGGDDGSNPGGNGCTVEDLCADGWHVCSSAQDFAGHVKSGSCPVGGSAGFWVSRQTQSNVMSTCVQGLTDTNNLVGCGEVLGQAGGVTCSPLDRAMEYTNCDQTLTWQCGTAGKPNSEGALVFKTAAMPGQDEGGALCCRD